MHSLAMDLLERRQGWSAGSQRRSAPKKPEQIPRTAAHTATGSVSTNDLEERVESNIERIN
jgi:hypothetical protein